MSSEADFSVPTVGKSELGAKIRVLVVDDHPPMRMGLVALIKSQPGMDVVAEASDGEEGVQVYADVLPVVGLIDLRMP